MAHIRQILANLSISVSEFKKNPKTVIKAVKSEPIAVIVNNRPAFYCVPADILESLYSKFYEMNEIQNIQDFSTSDNSVGVSDVDEGFGVQDIFQSIEDEQATHLPSDEDLVDPISNNVADPLDDEIRNQLGSSINQHLFNSTAKIIEENTSSVTSSFPDLTTTEEDFAAANAFGGDPLQGINDPLLPMSDSDEFNNVVSGDKTANRNSRITLTENTKKDQCSISSSTESMSADTALKIASETDTVNGTATSAFSDNADVRSLVSGPHSYSLDHVAKTYSPYKHKKAQAKRLAEQKKEIKKEHKAHKKELKKLERAAKALRSKAKFTQALSAILNEPAKQDKEAKPKAKSSDSKKTSSAKASTVSDASSKASPKLAAKAKASAKAMSETKDTAKAMPETKDTAKAKPETKASAKSKTETKASAKAKPDDKSSAKDKLASSAVASDKASSKATAKAKAESKVKPETKVKAASSTATSKAASSKSDDAASTAKNTSGKANETATSSDSTASASKANKTTTATSKAKANRTKEPASAKDDSAANS